MVIADFYRQNRPLFTFGSAAAIMIVLLVSFALTPRADDLALFAIAATMSVAALYAVRNTPGGDRVLTAMAYCVRRGPGGRLQALIAVAAVGLAILTGLLSKTLHGVDFKPAGALTLHAGA